MRIKHQFKIRDASEDRQPEIQSTLAREDFQKIIGQTNCQQYHPQSLCFQSTSVPLVTELLRALDQLSDTPHT